MRKVTQTDWNQKLARGIQMTTSGPRYSKEEFARRGDEIYERDIRPLVEEGNVGKYVAIDIETGMYEVDTDELAAADRLQTRAPNAQTWLRRVESPYVRRFGARLAIPPS